MQKQKKHVASKRISKNCIVALLSLVLFSTVLMIPMGAEAGTREHGYTYNYDYWEDVQDSPDFYNPAKVLTSVDLGLDKNFSGPSGLTVFGDKMYICDSGNNRIVEFDILDAENLQLSRVIEEVKGTDPATFSNPTDIAVSVDGNLFICDQGNNRVIKVDPELNHLVTFVKPTDSALDPQLAFQPKKLVVDTAERVYCIATGINKGLCKYEPDGVFSGFIGATPASYDFLDYIWKKFASQEQRAQMEAFVPTEYDNIVMDNEGFIYAVTSASTEDDLRTETADAVRKLNLLGNDILVRNGNYPVYGDLYWGDGAGHEGPSLFSDVCVFDNDIYACLDRNRGRVFAYDDQGRMVFAFGGNGNMDGYFRNPVGIATYGHNLYVLDSLDCAVTVFVPTEFGSLVYEAIEEFDEGDYDASGKLWEDVMAQNGNYDLAYIGIGRSLLRQEKYHEAMEYFELKYDDENYSKAFKQYRKEWVEEHIVIIVIVLLAVFLIPLGIGRYKKIKHDIDTADIFVINS
ncbi:MAG: NHL repeat-containing protein [Lachnospiraceae bacterium]|nr:NHL repeat-containing protein [Lachnospiraceae bacterium]